MKDQKYILTEETRHFRERTLHRIQAVTDFSDVKNGDLGGWVESEKNLAQYGKSWVYPGAIAMNEAHVRDNAVIRNMALVKDHALVRDNAIIDEGAAIYDKAIISGYAIIRGSSTVHECAEIFCDAIIEGDVWISGDALIGGDAIIKGRSNIKIGGYAKILKNAYIENTQDYIVIGPTGRTDHFATFYLTKEHDIYVTTGCFCGSLNDFRKAVRYTHAAFSKYRKAYLSMSNFAKKALL